MYPFFKIGVVFKMIHKVRRKQNDIYCLLTYVILPFVLMTLIHHISLTDALTKMDDGLFGSYNSCIYFENERTDSSLRYLWENNDILKKIDYSVMQEQQINDIKIRTLYFNHKYVTIPMEKGRFFRAHDFQKGNNVVVIGKNYVEKIKRKDGKDIITFNETDYEVLGIMGYEQDSVFDNYIYVNMFSDYIMDSNLYKIDCLSGSEMDTIIDSYLDYLNDNGYNVKSISVAYSYSASITEQMQVSKWFVRLLFCTFLCMMIISIQWIKTKKRNLLIKKLYGASDFKVVKEVINFILIYMGISFLFIFLLCKLIFPNYTSLLSLVYFISTLVIILIGVINIHILLRTPLQEVLHS